MSVKMKSWDPKKPYMAALKKRESQGLIPIMDEYLVQQESYELSPAFYFDVSSYLFDQTTRKEGEKQKKWRDTAIQILTSVLELGLDDPTLIRIVAYVLDSKGECNLAIDLFERVLQLRKEEPQSYRDLALALARKTEIDINELKKIPADKNGDGQDKKCRQNEISSMVHRVISLFVEVVKGKWDSRFNEIEITVLMELNAFVAKTKSINWIPRNVFEIDLPEELLQNLICDLRISLAWDTDMTDIDLHVIEPKPYGEKAYYQHPRTVIGGQVSRDFTKGYGPEEYLLKKGVKGAYKVRAKFYANHRQDMAGATTVLLSLYTDFGRPKKEKYQMIALRLTGHQETIDVGKIVL